MLSPLRRIADASDPTSLASRMRARRFAFFGRLLRELPEGARVLDAGGTADFWAGVDMVRAGRIRLTLLNLEYNCAPERAIEPVVGDARDMRQFSDGEFDAVFSNSVIEHVGSFADQQSMAREIRRVGRRYFVQTPNRYFPIEPHFLLPLFQFYPRGVRAALVQRYQLGWMPRRANYAEALREVEQVRLLSAADMLALFPDAELYWERFAGLAKSLVAYGGWGRTAKQE